MIAFAFNMDNGRMEPKLGGSIIGIDCETTE